MRRKILLAFDDPGGGLAVSSLLDDINREISSDLVIYSGKLSMRILKENFENIKDNIEIREISSFIDKEEAERITGKENPDLLITGTGGGNAEQELRNAAFNKDIKSIVILDYWKDYSRRWKYSDYSYDDMKDKICVMDELTKKEMEAEKFKSENIIVTGHPYLDKIFSSKSMITAEKNEAKVFNKILFLSQPLEIIGVKEYKTHPLEIFLTAISRIAERTREKLSVKIKLHPSEERSTEITEISEKYNGELIEVALLLGENSLNELIENSDIVAGYSTMALFESRASGKRTISLKVAEINNSLQLAMEDAGIEITEPDIESIIIRLLNGESGTTDLQKFSGGIDNCLKLIRKELSIN